jgi:hypothetical protein
VILFGVPINPSLDWGRRNDKPFLHQFPPSPCVDQIARIYSSLDYAHRVPLLQFRLLSAHLALPDLHIGEQD